MAYAAQVNDGAPPPIVARFRTFIASRGLAAAAVLTWCFTVAGFVLSRIDGVPEGVAVAAFVIAYLCGGTMSARQALTDLLHRHVNVDLLMVLAALGAASLGQWLEGAILLGLFSTSNALEFYAMRRTRQAVAALMDLTPPTARRQQHGTYVTVDIEEIGIGDIVLVQPGERIPVDARITQGESAVDQAAITGESVPVRKRVGDDVFAGTINGNGSMLLEVTKFASDSTLARIVRLVEDAQDDPSDLQQFAEGFEGKYAVFVIIVSTLVTLVPIMFGVDAGDAFYRGMTLLVVLSPCALVISTPAATLSAIANAARRGVLVKGGRALDLLGRIDTVAFDKTGTLTFGQPLVSHIVAFRDVDSSRILATTAAAEMFSEHPLGTAIVNAARRDGLDISTPTDLVAHPGEGIVAEVNGKRVSAGNHRLMESSSIDIPDSARSHQERLNAEGMSTMFVAEDGRILGIIAVADVLRPSAARDLAELRRLGIRRIAMLTGDNAQVAAAIAGQVGIDDIRAELLPEDKLNQIDDLRHHGAVAMLGDGINDAPALARANIGIAMGGIGSDAALETADVVLMSDDLSRVSYAIGLSRKARRIIRANLVFALGVIATLATLNLVIGIPLPLGVVGHEGSTVLVILNGLRLLGYGGNWHELINRSAPPAEPRLPQYQVIAA